MWIAGSVVTYMVGRPPLFSCIWQLFFPCLLDSLVPDVNLLSCDDSCILPSSLLQLPGRNESWRRNPYCILDVSNTTFLEAKACLKCDEQRILGPFANEHGSRSYNLLVRRGHS